MRRRLLAAVALACCLAAMPAWGRMEPPPCYVPVEDLEDDAAVSALRADSSLAAIGWSTIEAIAWVGELSGGNALIFLREACSSLLCDLLGSSQQVVLQSTQGSRSLIGEGRFDRITVMLDALRPYGELGTHIMCVGGPLGGWAGIDTGDGRLIFVHDPRRCAGSADCWDPRD